MIWHYRIIKFMKWNIIWQHRIIKCVERKMVYQYRIIGFMYCKVMSLCWNVRFVFRIVCLMWRIINSKCAQCICLNHYFFCHLFFLTFHGNLEIQPVIAFFWFCTVRFSSGFSIPGIVFLFRRRSLVLNQSGMFRFEWFNWKSQLFLIWINVRLIDCVCMALSIRYSTIMLRW